MVHLDPHVTHLRHSAAHILVPDVAALFGAVDSLIEPQDHTFWDLKTSRGLHIDLLLELAVEVSHLDVHLMDSKVLLDSNGEDSVEGQELDDWGEHLIVIKAFDLSKALGDDVCLILLYLAIWSTFDMENPLTSDYFASFQPWDYIVNPHLLEVPDFIFAGRVPFGGIGARHGLLVGSRVVSLVREDNVGLFRGARSAVGRD